MGADYAEVRQNALPEGDPLRGYSSPTILAGQRVLFGGKSEGGACTVGDMAALPGLLREWVG